MQLRRILALTILAVLGGAISSAAAYDFSDVNATHTMPDAEETSSHVTDDESRIYGGREADVSKYPWTISLRGKPEGYTYCGGTLVTPQYIVTAAHCVNNTTMYAAIGAQASEGIQGGERIRIAEAWVHEKYNESMNDYDIAVMKLETPSTATTLPLAAADGSQNQPNTMAVVRGWGVTQTKQPAKTLLEVNVKIITNALCSRSYNRITTRMLCAGAGGGKDTCQGDSGGALVANGALVGVVSWGGECGAAPGVYVRVTSVLDFINSKIAGGGEAPASAASQSSQTAAT